MAEGSEEVGWKEFERAKPRALQRSTGVCNGEVTRRLRLSMSSGHRNGAGWSDEGVFGRQGDNGRLRLRWIIRCGRDPSPSRHVYDMGVLGACKSQSWESAPRRVGRDVVSGECRRRRVEDRVSEEWREDGDILVESQTLRRSLLPCPEAAPALAVSGACLPPASCSVPSLPKRRPSLLPCPQSSVLTAHLTPHCSPHDKSHSNLTSSTTQP